MNELRKNNDIVLRMINFLKMWLLLRGLSDEIRYTASITEDLEKKYSNGQRPYCNRNQFAIAISNNSLVFYILPRFLRLKIRKNSIINISARSLDKIRLAEIHELLDCAEPEYIIESKQAKEENEASMIRLTSSDDREGAKSYGLNFITISGVLEDLVRKFPATWGVIAIALVPWLISHYLVIKNATAYVSPWW